MQHDDGGVAPPAPRLLTFDIFGTVVDWRRGLTEAVAVHGRPLGDGEFDAVVDAQGRLESEAFRSYREITACSLVEVLGMDPVAADAVGEGVGRWPFYGDAPAALRRLAGVAPCVAMTNSDGAHGRDVRERLGGVFADWIPAEEVRVYKPAPAFWHAAAARRGVPFDRGWWHVSAYADYDLDAARALGLTTVLVRRPHCRPGPADLEVADLAELADRLGA